MDRCLLLSPGMPWLRILGMYASPKIVKIWYWHGTSSKFFGIAQVCVFATEWTSSFNGPFKGKSTFKDFTLKDRRVFCRLSQESQTSWTNIDLFSIPKHDSLKALIDRFIPSLYEGMPGLQNEEIFNGFSSKIRGKGLLVGDYSSMGRIIPYIMEEGIFIWD